MEQKQHSSASIPRIQEGDPIRLRFGGNLIQIQHFNAIEDIAGAFHLQQKLHQTSHLRDFWQ